MKNVSSRLIVSTLLALGLPIVQAACIEGFKNRQRLHPYNEAKQSAQPFFFAKGEPLGEVIYKAQGDLIVNTLEDYFSKHCTTGFLVLHKGQIVYEKYLQGVKPDDALLSASMSKSILSLLIGVAISEGKLALNDRIKDVLPDFEHSAFADNSIEELLRMTSGVALKNSFITGDSSDNLATNPIYSPRQNMHTYLREKKEMSASGKKFEYNGALTALLGLVLRARTGKTNTDYLAEKLWTPMGAMSSGYWIKNFKGEEGVQGLFSATLSDYARIGYLVMNKGIANGIPVIPEPWIAQMVALRYDKPQPANTPFYGLHIWIPYAAGGRSIFLGTNGQYMYVDPVAQVVIVHTGNSPDPYFREGHKHLVPLRDAIVTKLANK
jgi:CubicO group peptidase (beta-lactamase class C family)